jgi:hypothetical protein
VERPARYETNLIWKFVTYGCKKFHNIDSTTYLMRPITWKQTKHPNTKPEVTVCLGCDVLENGGALYA